MTRPGPHPESVAHDEHSLLDDPPHCVLDKRTGQWRRRAATDLAVFRARWPSQTYNR